MIGRTIGQYQILDKLGEGGMGVVYKAEDTKLHRQVALKFLSSAALENEDERERFIREARAAARLDHPSICTVYEVGEHDGQPFLSMQFLEGDTIRDAVIQEPLAVKDAIRYAMQVLDGLGDAHDEGIVHRDIKSSNIMITAKGRAKVLDFGLATLPGSTRITHAGSTLGTAAYMSPEQAQGDDTDGRTDLWSFGVVFYEMLTGQLPFSGTLPAAMLYAVVHETPAPLVGVPAEMQPGLQAVIDRALAKSPDDRYATAAEFSADLEAVANEFQLRLSSGTRIALTSAQPVAPSGSAPVVTQASQPISTGSATSESVAPTGSAPTVPPHQVPLWKRPLFYLAMLSVSISLFFLLGGPSWFGVAPPPAPGAPAASEADGPNRFSIAVLPLASLGGSSEEDAFFADGLTDSLIGQLAKIEGLSVISRTSVMAYRGSGKTLPEIAEELNVRHVIEGSVRKAGMQVRVQTQLVDAENGATLWSETYDRELDNLLVIESEVAMAVAKAIDVELTDEDEKRMHAMTTMDPEALQICIRAQERLQSPGPNNLRAAEALFLEVLEIDPGCGQAFEGLSMAYAKMALTGVMNPGDALREARTYAEKALGGHHATKAEQPHLALGIVSAYLDWDWEAAREHFEQAIELNPGLAASHILYAHNYFLPKGDLDGAEQRIRHARQLDPRNPATIVALANIFALRDRPDDAIRAYDRALDHDPDFIFAHWGRARVKASQGRVEEAAADVDALREKGVRSPMVGAASAYFHALLGENPDMSFLGRGRGRRGDGPPPRGGDRGAGKKSGRGGPPYFSPYWAAAVAAARGEEREAYQWLVQGVNVHDPLVAQLRTAPEFAKFRNTREAEMLLRRINLGS